MLSPCVDCVNKAHCRLRGGKKPCAVYIGPKLSTIQVLPKPKIAVSK